jgi:sulfite oxidase
VAISGKHPALVVRQTSPFNGGPPPELLGRSVVTPAELFFVRNHGSVPDVDPMSYRLSVDGLVHKPLRLSADELRAQFSEVVQEATLQCAGNRRRELMDVKPIPGELEWDVEAIGNAVWRGIRLSEVLQAAGLDDRARHVAFLGLDEVRQGGRAFGFGGSIPLEKALCPEVLLAYEMNGEPLPPLHGFPLRVVVPGYVGARSVKWLARITVAAKPSGNYFQNYAYRLFPAQISAEEADWERGVPLGEFPVNAAILQPGNGDGVTAGPLTVRGYAVSSRAIARVDVSLDGGDTWKTADLLGEGSAWSWRLWELQSRLEPGTHHIAVRAWDAAGQTQPEDPATIWNFKGYANTAWHKITIHAS